MFFYYLAQYDLFLKKKIYCDKELTKYSLTKYDGYIDFDDMRKEMDGLGYEFNENMTLRAKENTRKINFKTYLDLICRKVTSDEELKAFDEILDHKEGLFLDEAV